MISTKGRYALRILIDLAEQEATTPVPLRDIAKQLVDQGLIVGTSGKGGGYLMARAPQECTVADVLAATEGSLAPVACLACETAECERQDTCKTFPMWQKFDEMTREYFGNVTIADLLSGAIASIE